MKFLPKSWKTFHEWVQWTSGIFLNSRRESLYLQAAMECSIYYINTNEIQNHFTLIFFGAKGAMYYVAIATVIFSHVKISCFYVKAHLVFHWLLQNELCLVVRDLNFPCTWSILLRLQQYFWEKRRRISIKLKQLHPNIWPIMSHIQNKWVSLKKLVSQQGENIESDNIIQTMIF